MSSQLIAFAIAWADDLLAWPKSVVGTAAMTALQIGPGPRAAVFHPLAATTSSGGGVNLELPVPQK